MRPRALTVAGSDPTGGAGIQQDLKTFAALGVWGLSAVTALTVQDTSGVSRWEPVEPALVRAQIAAVVADLGSDAAKTGMLGTVEMVDAVARVLADRPSGVLVVDPVLRAGSGDPLSHGDLIAALRGTLLPRATLVTPNAIEASVLSGIEITNLDEQKEAAVALAAGGPSAVLVTGGHLEGRRVIDVLFVDDELHEISARRVEGGDIHGTGCALSAAITAFLARGEGIEDAVRRAHALVGDAIARAMTLGKGAKVLDVRA